MGSREGLRKRGRTKRGTGKKFHDNKKNDSEVGRGFLSICSSTPSFSALCSLLLTQSDRGNGDLITVLTGRAGTETFFGNGSHTKKDF